MTRRSTVDVTLRIGFVLAVVLGAWWSLRGRWTEVGQSVVDTSPLALTASLVLVCAGLLGTGVLWRRILAGHGGLLPEREVRAIFFVGQLGKYVPGSVWSIGVQARMASLRRVPARATVSTSLVFLIVHLATGALVVAVSLPWIDDTAMGASARCFDVVALGCAVAGAVAMLPAILKQVARRVAAARDVAWRGEDSGFALLVMAATWFTYTLALWALVAPGTGLRVMPLLAAAFAAGYVVGVLVPFSPAGLGAREGVMLLLLSPALGAPEAMALTIMARVVHTAADFLVAGAAWLRR